MPKYTLFGEDRHANLQMLSRDKDMMDTVSVEQESMWFKTKQNKMVYPSREEGSTLNQDHTLKIQQHEIQSLHLTSTLGT